MTAMKGFWFTFLGISLVLNVLVIGFLLKSDDSNSLNATQAAKQVSFPLLSPRIFIENQNDLIINFVPLRLKLQEYASKTPHRIGLYFEYLPTGTSIGVNEKEAFIPASLLKTPLAMGVLKLSESKKIMLDDYLTLKEKHKDSNFGNYWKEKTGKKFQLAEVLKQLLIYSDNTAQKMLLEKVSTSVIEDVFESLDIPKIRDEDLNPVVTAKNYSSILRCLYLACYLTKEDSNSLLTILTNTIFKDKLPAGIPESIAVAHKIGVAESSTGGIYTDCGIVYYPKRPYILCVMIEGDEKTATKTISEISKIVYSFIKAQ